MASGRWAQWVKAFPFTTLRGPQVGEFFSQADFATLPHRFREAYWNQFIRRPKDGVKKSSWHWPILHAIGISATVGFLIHQKHQTHKRKDVLGGGLRD